MFSLGFCGTFLVAFYLCFSGFSLANLSINIPMTGSFVAPLCLCVFMWFIFVIQKVDVEW